MKRPQSVKFIYLYRDSGNSKAWGEVVFANPGNLSVDEVELRLKKALDMGCLFIADQIQIPEVFLYLQGDLTAEDHCFHEFDSAILSDESPNDQLERSIELFVCQVETESQRGWRAFDPIDKIRRLSIQ